MDRKQRKEWVAVRRHQLTKQTLWKIWHVADPVMTVRLTPQMTLTEKEEIEEEIASRFWADLQSRDVAGETRWSSPKGCTDAR